MEQACSPGRHAGRPGFSKCRQGPSETPARSSQPDEGAGGERFLLPAETGAGSPGFPRRKMTGTSRNQLSTGAVGSPPPLLPASGAESWEAQVAEAAQQVTAKITEERPTVAPSSLSPPANRRRVPVGSKPWRLSTKIKAMPSQQSLQHFSGEPRDPANFGRSLRLNCSLRIKSNRTPVRPASAETKRAGHEKYFLTYVR